MNLLNKLTIVVTLFLVSLHCFAKQESKITFASEEIAPGLYMLSGKGGFVGGNIALAVGKEGIIMIDDSMPPMIDELNKAIKAISDKPVDFLINTHVHGDHTGNNEAMGKSGAIIVAHENLREHLVSKGIRTQKGMEPAPAEALPVITFSHEMDFFINGKVNAFHVANAHTDGDVAIVFEDVNVIHAGDMFFNGLFPYIDLNNNGSVEGYIKAQKRILALCDEKTKIIPGHGPLASKDDLKHSVAMLEDSVNIIDKLLKSGKSEDQIIQLNPLSKYHDTWNWGFITTEKMTRQLYKGLK